MLHKSERRDIAREFELLKKAEAAKERHLANKGIQTRLATYRAQTSGSKEHINASEDPSAEDEEAEQY